MQYGLFKVTDKIYQIRGFDLSNITFIEGNKGWVVFDPLISPQTAKAALAFINKTQGSARSPRWSTATPTWITTAVPPVFSIRWTR